MSAEWVTAIATILAVLVAFYGVLVAKEQLTGFRETLRTNSLMAVLAIESELTQYKAKCDDISLSLLEKNLDAQKIELLKKSLKAAEENWLNCLERLCFCILKEYVPEKDWRTEYRDYLYAVIKERESLFGEASKYTNIKTLNKRWREA